MNKIKMLQSMLVVASLALWASLDHGPASTLSKAVRTSASMEPALVLPAQDKAATQKLSDLRAEGAL